MQCQWIWMPGTMTLNDMTEKNDSERQKRERRWWLKMPEWMRTTTPNAKTKKKKRPKMHEWVWNTTLKAKTKEKKWARRPKEVCLMVLNARIRKMVMDRMKGRHEDSECRTENAAPNAKEKMSNGSERLNEDKWWLWTIRMTPNANLTENGNLKC